MSASLDTKLSQRLPSPTARNAESDNPEPYTLSAKLAPTLNLDEIQDRPTLRV